MTDELERYSKITEGFRREFILLQGTGCRWRKCTFCDYHLDTSKDPFSINRPVLDMVTGDYGVLDVINSGSAMEFDPETISYIRKVCEENNIGELWFEAHWMYHKVLDEFSKNFPGIRCHYRVGAETFNPVMRDAFHKGVPASVTAEEMGKYYDGCCLIVGIKGQTKEDILRDVELAEKWFSYYSVNLFCPNGTATERDEELADFVKTVIKEKVKDSTKCELLIENTDLGVG